MVLDVETAALDRLRAISTWLDVAVGVAISLSEPDRDGYLHELRIHTNDPAPRARGDDVPWEDYLAMPHPAIASRLRIG